MTTGFGYIPLDSGEIIDIPSPHRSLSTKNQICVFVQAIALVEDSSAGWWDENKESLAATIHNIRPDLHLDIPENAQPIPYHTTPQGQYAFMIF